MINSGIDVVIVIYSSNTYIEDQNPRISSFISNNGIKSLQPSIVYNIDQFLSLSSVWVAIRENCLDVVYKNKIKFDFYWCAKENFWENVKTKFWVPARVYLQKIECWHKSFFDLVKQRFSMAVGKPTIYNSAAIFN